MFQKAAKKYKSIPVPAKASFWFLICSFLQKGISAITTPIFTRLMTTAEYGQFSVFTSWQSILLIVVSLNLWGGVYMQGMVKFKEHRAEYSSSLQGLTLVLVLAWSTVYAAIHDIWNGLFSLSTVQMVCMLLMVWTSSSFCFWSSEQRVDFKYKGLVTVTIFVSLAKPILEIVLLTLSKDKVTARIVGVAIVELLIYPICFASQMRRGKKFFSKTFWKYAVAFNLPLLPHYLSMTILASSDRIMISNMCGEAQVGIYSLAYSVSNIMTLFNSALLSTLEPWIYSKIKEKRIEDIKRVAYPAFIFIAVVNIALIIFAPEIVAIFAPAEYKDAIWVIPPVAMSSFFSFCYTFFATFEFYYEKTKSIASATIAGAVANIILNYIFIQIFGYKAAGYTTLLCYILFALFHFLMMRKVCRIYLDGRKAYDERILFAISGVFTSVGFLLLFTYNHMVVRYGFVLVGLVAILVFRKRIVAEFKQLMSLKNRQE